MRTQDDNLDRLVDDLLYEPPPNADELTRRFGEHDPSEVREALVGRIEEGAVDDIDAVIAGNIFEVLGLDGCRDRLVDIVSSPMPDAAETHRQARHAAFVVLAMNTEFDPDAPDVTFGLSPERYTELAASVYSSLFEFTELNIDLIFDFGEMLLQEPTEVRPDLFDQLESYRADTAVDAGVLYRPLLEDDDYAELWPLLIDAVVDEGVGPDADWLQRRAEQAADETMRQRFQKAAMELRTRGLDETAIPEGFALLGTPDGAGAYPVFVFTERDGGTYAGHNLVFQRLSHSVRDGFFIRDIIDEEIDNLADDIEQTRATRLTKIPIARAIRLVRDELAKNETPLEELPPETRLAIYRLERLPHGGIDVPEPTPASEIDREAVAELFETDACFDSWFVDRATLERAGALPVPDREEDPAEWKAQAGPKLSELEGVGDRVIANFEFIALWYLLDGDERMAGQLAAVARDARGGFADSVALDLLLDQTIVAVREMQDYAGAFVYELLGDDSLRARLHDAHLDMKGFDEATEDRYLDYMEMAYRTLEEIAPELPDHLRPDSDQMMDAAGPIGIVTANFFATTPVDAPSEVAESVSQELVDAGIDSRAAGFAVSELLTNGRLLAMLDE